MKPVYTNIVPLANSTADQLGALEDLCRTKVAEVLQAYLDAEADDLIQRRRYERRDEGARVLYRNGHDPQRLITTPAGAIPIRRPRAWNDVHIGRVAQACSTTSKFGSHLSQALARRALAARF